MKMRNAWLLGAMSLAVAIGLTLLGCDTTETTDSALSVTPSSVVLTNAADTVAFTAASGGTNATLVLPLVWTVSDDSLGIIKSSAGVTAIYESKGKVGNNTVTVRDQGQAEGIAMVNQR